MEQFSTKLGTMEMQDRASLRDTPSEHPPKGVERSEIMYPTYFDALDRGSSDYPPKGDNRSILRGCIKHLQCAKLY
jgi:hypothetical protein